jgi:hypothetical protein
MRFYNYGFYKYLLGDKATTYKSEFTPNDPHLKIKSHKHQIIPEYTSKNIFVQGDSYFWFVVSRIDAIFSSVPFYFLFIMSLSSLFLLFFIFLNNMELIVTFSNKPCFTFFNMEFFPPKNPKAF